MNELRPCPMLENPEKLREMVSCAGVHSTDLQNITESESTRIRLIGGIQ